MRCALIIALLLAVAMSSCNAGHSVTLKWTEAATGISSYSIYRSPHAVNSYILLVSTTALTYKDVMVLAGQSYDYYVIAIKAGVDSARSNLVTATVP